MVPSSSANIDPSLGLLWHADGAIKRGILSIATAPATAAGTNGAVICADVAERHAGESPQPDVRHRQWRGRNGQLLTLIGTQSSVSPAATRWRRWR